MGEGRAMTTLRIAQDETADQVLSTDSFGLLVRMLLDQRLVSHGAR
jgi:hypothetical protein